MDFREAYSDRSQAELDEYDAEIKTFDLKSSGVPVDEQLQFYADLQTLRRHSKVRQKLGEPRNASDAGWSDLKEELEIAWKELQSGMERTERTLKAGSDTVQVPDVRAAGAGDHADS